MTTVIVSGALLGLKPFRGMKPPKGQWGQATVMAPAYMLLDTSTAFWSVNAM